MRDAMADLDRHQVDPILGEFFEHTTSPTQAQIDFLVKRHCVPATALSGDGDGDGWIIGTAHVEFDGELLFDFADRDGDSVMAALIFIARDVNGDSLDLIAWLPRTDKIVTRFGRAPVLGEHNLVEGGFDKPISIHRGILDWLRAGRRGIVIIDPRRAGRSLIDTPERLAAVDRAHAEEIAALMTGAAGLERILIPAEAA